MTLISNDLRQLRSEPIVLLLSKSVSLKGENKLNFFFNNQRFLINIKKNRTSLIVPLRKFFLLQISKKTDMWALPAFNEASYKNRVLHLSETIGLYGGIFLNTTCHVTMLTCQIFMSSCQIFFFNCHLFIY